MDYEAQAALAASFAHEAVTCADGPHDRVFRGADLRRCAHVRRTGLAGVQFVDLSPAAQAALDEALAEADAGHTELYGSIEHFDAALRTAVVGDLVEYPLTA